MDGVIISKTVSQTPILNRDAKILKEKLAINPVK